MGVDENEAFEPSPAVREKRGVENGAVSASKKQRCGGGLKRVAEIVLVLSTMGTMRGAKNPTSVEMSLMAEARETLAEMCGEMEPKDIVGREAIGNVIEELGLNSKLKEQRLGFRGMGMSISQKVLLAKMKVKKVLIVFFYSFNEFFINFVFYLVWNYGYIWICVVFFII